MGSEMCIRDRYRPGRERLNNPDYTFLSIHFEAVRDYLSLLDWDLRHDEANGCFYVINTDEANRLILSKRETAILLALRMLYDESQERLGPVSYTHLTLPTKRIV